MEKVRLGIIGVGAIGLPVSKYVGIDGHCPDITLTAICDISQERREWAANLLKCRRD